MGRVLPTACPNTPQLRVACDASHMHTVPSLSVTPFCSPSYTTHTSNTPLTLTLLPHSLTHTLQLRGKADKRQVPGAKLGLQHNLGLGGAAVVTLYRKPEA